MINMELEFKCSALKQLKYYKKKNPIAYKIIREKLEEIINNPEDSNYKKVYDSIIEEIEEYNKWIFEKGLDPEDPEKICLNYI